MGRKILIVFCSQEKKLSRHVILLDNPKAHTKDDFKKLVNSLNGVVWYGLPNATDLWQLVDDGCAQLLKSPISIKHRE